MRILVLASALALALVAPATAAHCTTYSTSTATIDTGVVYYVCHELSGWPGGCSILVGGWFWVYAESNGIPGLQRLDEIGDDTCHGLIASDTIVF